MLSSYLARPGQSSNLCDHRVVHGSDGLAGRVTVLLDFGGSGGVGSAFWVFKFLTDYFWVAESIRIFKYDIRIECFSYDI